MGCKKLCRFVFILAIHPTAFSPMLCLLAGALSAGGAEAVAPYISKWLYGKEKGSDLTAEEKETVSAITSLLGTATSAAVGNSATDAAQGSLNAQSAVGNNYNLEDAEQDIKRIGGSLLGTAAAIGDLATPILNPKETLQSLKLLATSPDRLELLQLGFVLLVNERQQEYDLFVKQNDVFGQSMVIGRSTGDIGLAVGGAAQLVAKSPSALKYFSVALTQLKRTGSATINGIKVVYVAGKISRAADNYLPPSMLKPIPSIIQEFGRPTKTEIANAAQRIAQHRANVNTKGGNFGYLDGIINGKQVDNKIWRSTSIDTALHEPQIFIASQAVNTRGNSWLRITDAEYRMLNDFAHKMGAKAGNVYPNIRGHLKIVSENPFCSSCSNVIQQFRHMFPNIQLILINGTRK